VVYPGNIQGLNITETGERGCYVVDVKPDRSVEAVFHPLDEVRWTRIEVDIADLASLDRLEETLLQAVETEQAESGNRGLICRVVLRGRGPLHAHVSDEEGQDDLLQRFREHFTATEPLVWIKDIRVETAPDIDLRARRRQQDFLGEVLAQAEEIQNREDRVELLHKEILSELFGHRRAKRFLRSLSPEETDELLRRAELLCADWLEQSGD
jgi:DNA repair exonuclease SbcCD nuclease subunit